MNCLNASKATRYNHHRRQATAAASSTLTPLGVALPSCDGIVVRRRSTSETPCSTGTVRNDTHMNINDEREHIIVLGAGIAGLATARYLISLQTQRRARITLIDRNLDLLPPNEPSPGSSYEQQICEQLHYSIPSRRNGNVICPSLTVPWTTRPLWKEVFLPGLKSVFDSDEENTAPAITLDWKSLITDRHMWSFGAHFLLQKLLLGRKEHQSNQTILEYNMKCLDDPSDELVQGIEYGRCAVGTKLLDGSIKDCDSSGDIGLFCRGLLSKLLVESYDSDFTVIPGEDVVKLNVKDKVLQGVTTMSQHGDTTTRAADKIVVALGVNSTSLCKEISVPCPIYPVKGHLVTVSSSVDCKYNLTLDGGVGYAAPMDHIDAEGRRLYRLSGFVDFELDPNANHERIEALIDAARVHLPDLEMIDASACHRPISADDRPLIGPSAKYPNLFLCAGFGSRGWSIGLGSGKLLASQVLGLPCEINPDPYLPNRFSLGNKG